MLRLHSSTRKMDTVFIVCLFVLFSFTAGLFVILGATQYRATVDSMNHNYEVRTTSSYLAEKVRQHDTDAGITVTDFCGTKAIALFDTIDGKTYTTYIYYYDGALRELMVGDTASYSPGSGQSIISISSFEPELCDSGLIYITYSDTDGTPHHMYLDFHAATGKESS